MTIKRRLCALLLIIGVAVFLASSFINFAKADLTVNRTFTSSSSDGYFEMEWEEYAWCHNIPSAGFTTTGTTLTVGQAVPSNYQIWRSALFFDTSIIASTATITSAILSLYVSVNSSTTDFNVTIQSGMPTYPHDPLASGDYYYGWYGSGNGGSRNSSAITGIGYWNITLSATGLTYITKGGATKLFLRSSKDISGIAPSDNEYVTFSSNEAGSAQIPTLYVTYTVPAGSGGGSVTLHGPYLETGLVFNGVVNVTLFYSGNVSETYTLDGTDASADTVQLVKDEMPINCYWNLTSDYTKQRVYTFTPSSITDELWIHVADIEVQVVNQYYVSVTDFAGLTNAYVSTMKNVGGYTRSIERQPLDVMNNMPFWLITYNQYSLKVVSDQGTFTWNLPADVVGTKSYVITKDMVTQASTARNFTVSASRLNGSIINVRYYDPDGGTVSVVTLIEYYANYLWNTAYTQVDSSSDVDFNWSSAESARGYRVTITASYAMAAESGSSLTWQFYIAPLAMENVWSFSLDIFGNWGFPANQVPGLIIAGLFFGLLSWRDTEIGCAIGLCVTGVLCFAGLLDIPVMAVAMGFMFVVFMYLHKGKESLRYPP